jgi:hypothetical protein
MGRLPCLDCLLVVRFTARRLVVLLDLRDEAPELKVLLGKA